MPKVRNASETPTKRECAVSLRENKLLVATDGKRRVLLTRAALKRSYDEALEIISTHFPAIPKNCVVIQTDRLEGFEGEFVDVPKESWAEVLPLSLKITLDERELIAPHLVTDVPVRAAPPPPLLSTVGSAERVSGKVIDRSSSLIEMHFTASYSAKIAKLFPLFASKIGACLNEIQFLYEGLRIHHDTTFAEVDFLDGDIINCRRLQVGGKPVIYLFSPIEQEVSVQLSLVNEWCFSAVYPVVPTLTWRTITHNDQTLTETTTGLRASYLYWEAAPIRTDRIERPPSPLPETSESSPARSFIVLPVSSITPYLDKVLASLGLHVEARTSFITYWLPSILKHTHIALRFVPQNEYETAAVLHIEPSPDVLTRIFMLFKGISEDRLDEWSGTISRSQDEMEWWRNVVGLVSKERQRDEKLFRVLEWGGMETILPLIRGQYMTFWFLFSNRVNHSGYYYA
ncbi:hypothetical protein F5146DRAFT_1190868 [Armillaria mellea]|nr:hypothetical protein F5146DRAFT_1190868 [Armillaria mellea]